jgi:lipopolysaccharide transport system ATP-binding protein
MSPTEIEEKTQLIIDFSEVGLFINEPLKIYSSGMIMRLAFSIAVHANPDCFVVDEALAVGDAYFQQKCMRKIMEFRENGGALLFVSHDLNAVKLLCNKVLVLEKGKIVTIAEPSEATKIYNRSLAKVGSSETTSKNNKNSKGFGTRRAELLNSKIVGALSGSDKISSGEKTEIKCTAFCNEKIEDLVLGFVIRDRFGQDVFGTNSYLLGVKIPSFANEMFQANWSFVMNLGPGKYTLTLALHVGPDHTVECLHWEDATLEFEVAGVLGPNFVGLCKLDPSLLLISNNIDS